MAHGSTPQPLFVKQSITIPEVIQILENPPDCYLTVPPRKVKAGQAFIYKSVDKARQGMAYIGTSLS